MMLASRDVFGSAGMEVAAFLVGKATKVTCVSTGPTPFAKSLGTEIGGMVLKVCVCVCVCCVHMYSVSVLCFMYVYAHMYVSMNVSML